MTDCHPLSKEGNWKREKEIRVYRLNKFRRATVAIQTPGLVRLSFLMYPFHHNKCLSFVMETECCSLYRVLSLIKVMEIDIII